MIVLMILSYLIRITTFAHHFFFFFSEGTYIEIYREKLNCLDVYIEILLGEKYLSSVGGFLRPCSLVSLGRWLRGAGGGSWAMQGPQLGLRSVFLLSVHVDR